MEKRHPECGEMARQKHEKWLQDFEERWEKIEEKSKSNGDSIPKKVNSQ